MIGGAARVGGQKAQCFDCITHPERKKDGQKGVATQKLDFFRPRNENPGEKKETTVLLTVPEKEKMFTFVSRTKGIVTFFETHLTWPRDLTWPRKRSSEAVSYFLLHSEVEISFWHRMCIVSVQVHRYA